MGIDNKEDYRKFEVKEKFRSHFGEYIFLGVIFLLVAAYNVAAIYGFYKIIKDFFI